MGEKLNLPCRFIPFLQWNKKPILGMKLKDPWQVKLVLCNYVVANWYQLCFEKNGKKKLLVWC